MRGASSCRSFISSEMASRLRRCMGLPRRSLLREIQNNEGWCDWRGAVRRPASQCETGNAHLGCSTCDAGQGSRDHLTGKRRACTAACLRLREQPDRRAARDWRTCSLLLRPKPTACLFTLGTRPTACCAQAGKSWMVRGSDAEEMLNALQTRFHVVPPRKHVVIASRSLVERCGKFASSTASLSASPNVASTTGGIPPSGS